MVGPERPQFVIFGSSIVQFSYAAQGWGATLADIYSRKADVFLRGYAGWSSRHALQVLHKVFPKDAAVQPALVIVYFGGNDSTHPHSSGLGPHVPLPEYIENMRKIAIHLKSLSEKTRIIFLTAPPVSEARIESSQVMSSMTCAGPTVLVKFMQKHLWSYAVKRISRSLIFGRHCRWLMIGQQLALHYRDGIHLSTEGSMIVAKEILAALKDAEWEPSLYWKSMPIEFSEDSP